MKLKFLGRGAAFNPKEGNTSAYFIENNQLFLIDCGESIFEKLVELDLLNDIESINLMITHTHSDHIGSLGSLVMYAYYTLKRPLNIIIFIYLFYYLLFNSLSLFSNFLISICLSSSNRFSLTSCGSSKLFSTYLHLSHTLS